MFLADSFWMNPQFLIKLEEQDDDPTDNEEGCSFVVGLIQKNRRKMRKVGEDMHTIGFAIYDVPDELAGQRNIHLDRNFFMRHASAARSETFINLREVCSRFCLPPGEYLIVPSTFEPNKDGDFCVRIFSEKQAEFQELDDPVECSVPEINVNEGDIDSRFKSLFGQLAGAKDGSGKLGMVEFKILWTKIEMYLDIFCKNDKDNDSSLNIDFDNFVACMVRLESMFKTFKMLDKDKTGTIELNFFEARCTSKGKLIGF
ncbi:hypothetical protein cypCar_00028832 [Cyprinus carpio]|nr:hypothetical protein cypCar_00028832 [Cyprinus carpio]